MINLKNQKVLVTGQSSMIGRQVVSKLLERGAYVLPDFFANEDGVERVDLTNSVDCDTLFEKSEPDYVIHCAGFNGGIQFNKKYPADIFYKTAMMSLNVLNACEYYKVRKVVSILASCAYPNKEDVLNENDFGNGNSHETVECHGHAKRILFDYSKQIYKQHPDTLPICVVSNNSFGPHDSYKVDKTKFIGGAIAKIAEAKERNLDEVVFWGDGSPLREFVYCKDVAEGLIQALEKYNNPFDVINISGFETSIKAVVEEIAEIIGFKGKIVWDSARPNGQMRKKLDDTKMRDCLSLELTPFSQALKETIDWYYKYEIRNLG